MPPTDEAPDPDASEGRVEHENVVDAAAEKPWPPSHARRSQPGATV